MVTSSPPTARCAALGKAADLAVVRVPEQGVEDKARAADDAPGRAVDNLAGRQMGRASSTLRSSPCATRTSTLPR